LPTNLPHQPAKPKRTILGMILNAFMVSTVILLFVAVLLQEERYIHGEPGYLAGLFDDTAKADAAPRTMAD
jgi:hypothetical protein